ncbi:MAG TPA: YihY/virulence factor BrkB family protein [Alphaproteobacteria bacterium]|nr:YihY/virulence factor BrkB family protein [Alphaproteobacteria bacterium]
MARTEASDAVGRGRDATRPDQIPKAGWRDIVLRTKDEISRDNVGIVAAGVAFYGLLALFPALAALVSIYGLVANPADVKAQLDSLSGIVPQEALNIISGQLSAVASGSSGGLGFGAAIGILLSLWSATKAVSALFTALNIAYHEEEQRGFIKLNLMYFAFTIGAVLVAIAAIGGVVALPALLGAIGLGGAWEWLVSLARWPVLAMIAVLSMAVLYRYGPSRRSARWEWISWGAVAATLLWIAGSIGFSIYVRNFGSYNETYGSLGAVVILLMWFYLSAYILLMGAELNAEIEHQTMRDTTTGPEKPMGRRGAYVADHKGRRRNR